MRCPICGGLTHWKDNPFRPFCSERCKLIDFGHWVDEDYCVPAAEPASAEHETEPEPQYHPDRDDK